jgi:hypothetical protein
VEIIHRGILAFVEDFLYLLYIESMYSLEVGFFLGVVWIWS